MKDNYKFQIKVFLLALWTAFVLWHFWQRFPIVNALEIVLQGLLLGILILFFSAVGKRITRYFQIEFASYAEEVSFSFGIGTGVTIFLVIGLAALGLLYELLIVCLVLLLFALVYKEAKYLCIKGYEACSALYLQKKSPQDIICLLFVGGTGIITLLAAATPPFFYDALVYHLAVPQKYLFHHGFHDLPHHHFSHFPANLGMLFIVGMSFSGGILAKLISWVFAPMTALSVYAFSKSRWGDHIAMTSATVLFLIPGILITSIVATIDPGVMFYSFLSFSALLSWFSSRRKHWFVLSGIFCSLAVGTKYTAIVVTAVPLALILLVHEWFVKKESWIAGLQKAIVIGLIVLCGTSPWFIKNSLYTANPVYPFFNAVFGSSASHLIDYRQYLNKDPSLLREQLAQRDQWIDYVIAFFKAPWTVTMTTTRFAGKIGVLFLLCFPCLFFLKKIDVTARYLLALAGCSFGLWIVLLPGALRYVFPMLPPLSIVTAYILWNIPVSLSGRKWIFTGISVILLYHLVFLFGTTHDLRPFYYLFGNQSKREFLLGHGINYYPAMQYVNQQTPGDSKILFVAESRGYFCERDYELYTVVTAVDDHEILLRKLIVESETVEEVMQKLYDRGFTHIFVNLYEMQRFTRDFLSRDTYFGFPTAKDQEIFDQLFSPQYLRLLFSEYQVDLYEILYSGKIQP